MRARREALALALALPGRVHVSALRWTRAHGDGQAPAAPASRVQASDLVQGWHHLRKSLLPLVKWFEAMSLITQSKNSISSLELSRQLGVKYDSAWLLRQKLNAVMQANEAERKPTAASRWTMPSWAGRRASSTAESADGEARTKSLSSRPSQPATTAILDIGYRI